MAKITYKNTPEGRQIQVAYKRYDDAIYTLNKEIGKIRSKIAKKYELIAAEERKIANAYFEIGRSYKTIDELKRLDEDTSMIPTIDRLIKKITAEKEEKDKQAEQENKK